MEISALNEKVFTITDTDGFMDDMDYWWGGSANIVPDLSVSIGLYNPEDTDQFIQLFTNENEQGDMESVDATIDSWGINDFGIYATYGFGVYYSQDYLNYDDSAVFSAYSADGTMFEPADRLFLFESEAYGNIGTGCFDCFPADTTYVPLSTSALFLGSALILLAAITRVKR